MESLDFGERKFWELKIAKLIWVIFPPILIICGTIGNVLSFIVINQRHRQRTSTSTYLSALAICDLLVIYIGLLRCWLSETFNYDIRTINDVICKLHFYLVNLTLQLSSWILVAITTERLISIWKPHVAKKECTKGVASSVLIIMSTVLVVINGHMLFGVKISIEAMVRNDTGLNRSVFCEPDIADKAYSEFMYYIWTWVDFGIVFFLPFLLLMTSNIIIIINIKRSRKFRREVMSYRIRSQKPLISLTAMLLALNCVFFVCVGPVNVYIIGQFHWWPRHTEGHAEAIQTLLWATVNILMYTNNAANFLFYILCGSEFRAEVKRVLFSVCARRTSGTRETYTRRPLHPNTSFEMISV